MRPPCRSAVWRGPTSLDLEAGAALIDRALVLNPNLAAPWIASGWVRAFLGEPEASIDHLAT
jgi:hypothetical protein